MKPLVIYHANCTDGFGAAYAAWRTFGDGAEYVPMHYNDDPLKDIVYADREVYVLDFSLPRVDMDNLFDLAKRVVWLDHHKTAFEMWLGGYERGDMFSTSTVGDRDHRIILDDNRSGALIAWEYFYADPPPPLVIRHIDDRDRWQFKMKMTREVSAGLMLNQPWTFEQWDTLTSVDAYGDLCTQGAAAMAMTNQQVMKSVSKAKQCAIPHPSGLIVVGLAVNTPVNISEVGHVLATQGGTYGLMWYYDGDSGRANCSLRSTGEYDVSEIAKYFGGGGHKNAAGFNIDMPTLLGWLEGV